MAVHKKPRAYDSESKRNGKRLRQFRKSLKWSQKKLGEILGVDQSAVSRMEQGKQAILLTQMSAIALALGRSTKEVTIEFFKI